MFKSGFVLSTDEHIAAAMFNKTNVTVWQNGSIIDYGGPIEDLTDIAVKINDGYFLKEWCEFRVR